MRIAETITVRCRPSAVWERVGDPARYAGLIEGVTRWDPVDGTRAPEPRARYSMRMHVGSVEVGGVVEIVERAERCDLAWTGVTGIAQRGRWRLREVEPGVTAVSLRLGYQSPGGLWGLLADRVSSGQVRAAVCRTLQRLRDDVEEEAAGGEARAGGVTSLLSQQVNALRVVAGTGLLRPMRPDRLLAAGLALHRWGFTLPGGFAVNAARTPLGTAVHDERGALTFAQLDRRSTALANALAAAGIREDDHVALLCRNHRGFVEAALAAGKLGADLLLMNTGFAAPQLADVVHREHVVAVVHDAEFTSLVGDSVPAERRFVAWQDSESAGDRAVETLIAAGSTVEPDPPDRGGRITILTSGTTGAPKGASRAQPRSADPLIAVLSRIPLRARETTLIAAPLFHAWGLVHLGLGAVLGSTLVLQRRFDPERTLAAIAEHRVTALAAVPVMLQRILDLPEAVLGHYDTSSLRVVAVSGSALSADLAGRFMDRFGDVVYNLYGSTEVAWATIATPEDLRAAPGTAGRPPLGTVVRLLDESALEVSPGQSGRIFVGNEMLFEGYTGGGGKDVVGGLMATGDVGRFDGAGRLFVEGRDDEMIVSGGENVFPAEVEEALLAHGDIAEAACVGVEDEEWGQRLRAFVVPRPGARMTVDDVKDHVKARLARYKVPRDVEFVDALPRNATGKVVKKELAAHAEGSDAAAERGGDAARSAGTRTRGRTAAAGGRAPGADASRPAGGGRGRKRGGKDEIRASGG